jgi:hypothetical protein
MAGDAYNFRLSLDQVRTEKSNIKKVVEGDGPLCSIFR